jgi:ribose 5-phosphate isomerase A
VFLNGLVFCGALVQIRAKDGNGVSVDALKKAAALAAADLVQTHTVVGLGSGSTIAFLIEELGERIRQGRLQIVSVPTSYDTRLLARACGIPLLDAMDVDRVDLTIDGADEVDPAGNMIKGGGGAHVMEKLVAALAYRFVVIVDETKCVQTLGGRKYPVPVEVIAPALPFVARCLRDLGGKAVVRNGSGKLGPVISDLGHPIINVDFGPITDAPRLNNIFDSIPGVVGHGLFIGMADQVIVGRASAQGSSVDVRPLTRTTQPYMAVRR